MITSVDTNVLVDVLEGDPVHGIGSRNALSRCLREGTLVACDVVWAETATIYGEQQAELMAALSAIGLEYSEVTRKTALEAARHWHGYRAGGGPASMGTCYFSAEK